MKKIHWLISVLRALVDEIAATVVRKTSAVSEQGFGSCSHSWTRCKFLLGKVLLVHVCHDGNYSACSYVLTSRGKVVASWENETEDPFEASVFLGKASENFPTKYRKYLRTAYL